MESSRGPTKTYSLRDLLKQNIYGQNQNSNLRGKTKTKILELQYIQSLRPGQNANFAHA